MDDGEAKGGDHRPDLGGVQEARNVTGWVLIKFLCFIVF
jgi:hypothetical protein